MATHAKKNKLDPFKTRKSKEQTAKEADTLVPPPEIAEAIDGFRECQEQAKHFEGEATVYKDSIIAYARQQYAKRALKGHTKSFKIIGGESMVTFIVQDSTAGLSEDDVEEIASRWGDSKVEHLVMKDYGSIRFDPKVLEAHYEEVVEALQVLPEEVLNALFKPMLMKGKPQLVDTMRRFAGKEDDFNQMMQDLKLKHYIK